MIGKYHSLYKKFNEKRQERITVFKYLVNGTEEELKAYREALEAQGQPVHTEEESGKMIYFTTVHNGDTIPLQITTTGKIISGDDEMDKLQSKLSLAQDPAVKSAMASLIAQQLLGGASSAPAPVAQPTPVAETEVGEEDTDLN